jgi:hypothetical protein
MIASLRTKLRVDWLSVGPTGTSLRMEATYDPSLTAPNKLISDFTPTASMNMFIDKNKPLSAELFAVGQEYYVDVSRVVPV